MPMKRIIAAMAIVAALTLTMAPAAQAEPRFGQRHTWQQRMDRVGPRRLRLEPQSLHVDRWQPVLARELAAQAPPVQMDNERCWGLGRLPAQPAGCTYHRV